MGLLQKHMLDCPDCPKAYPGATLTLVPLSSLCPIGQTIRWQEWDRAYGYEVARR
jgi:hypothetical protein